MLTCESQEIFVPVSRLQSPTNPTAFCSVAASRGVKLLRLPDGRMNEARTSEIWHPGSHCTRPHGHELRGTSGGDRVAAARVGAEKVCGTGRALPRRVRQSPRPSTHLLARLGGARGGDRGRGRMLGPAVVAGGPRQPRQRSTEYQAGKDPVSLVSDTGVPLLVTRQQCLDLAHLYTANAIEMASRSRSRRVREAVQGLRPVLCSDAVTALNEHRRRLWLVRRWAHLRKRGTP